MPLEGHTTVETFVAEARTLLAPILHRSGNVLYSGKDTLCPGPLYLLGLNPGGDPSDHRHREQTIGSTLDSLRIKKENEYLDVSWRERGIHREPGEATLQRRVQHLAEILGLDLRTVCASNLIFARSTSAATSDYEHLAPICWPVHELILNIVQPRLIVAFGNSGTSPYNFLVSQFAAPREETFHSGHGEWVCRSFTTDKMRVVGVPHLSRYAIDRAIDRNPLLRERLQSLLD
jgi:hypothetical protein